MNPLLRADPVTACGAELEIHCYNDLPGGLPELRKHVGVAGDRLPTPVELEEIKSEQDTWLLGNTACMIVVPPAFPRVTVAPHRWALLRLRGRRSLHAAGRTSLV